MNIPTKETYSELYSILNMLGEEYITKLPEKIYARIENERDIEYNPVYVKDVELEKQGVSEQALASIAYFNLNFWSETIEEKAILNKLFASEEQEEPEKQQEQQSIKEDTPIEDNTDSVQIEENTQEQKQEEEQATETENINQEETSLIIHKEGFFTRIINKIKEFFSRKKHKIDDENEIEENQENKEEIAEEVEQEDNSDFQEKEKEQKQDQD